MLLLEQLKSLQLFEEVLHLFIPLIADVQKQKQSNYPQDSRMYDAARSGRMRDIKETLAEGVPINAVDFNTGNTALHAACMIQIPEMIKYLVDEGADPNFKNRRGQVLSFVAVTHLRLPCI